MLSGSRKICRANERQSFTLPSPQTILLIHLSFAHLVYIKLLEVFELFLLHQIDRQRQQTEVTYSFVGKIMKNKKLPKALMQIKAKQHEGVHLAICRQR